MRTVVHTPHVPVQSDASVRPAHTALEFHFKPPLDSDSTANRSTHTLAYVALALALQVDTLRVETLQVDTLRVDT